MKIYELKVAGDCEGRTSKTVGYFLNYDDADIIRKSGWKHAAMGGVYDANMAIREVKVYSTAMNCVTDQLIPASCLTGILDTAQLKHVALSQALSKLTDDERELVFAHAEKNSKRMTYTLKKDREEFERLKKKLGK